jgi:hypothetical protein
MVKSVIQHSYFEKKLKSKWVDFETTHPLDDCTQNDEMCFFLE